MPQISLDHFRRWFSKIVWALLASDLGFAKGHDAWKKLKIIFPNGGVFNGDLPLYPLDKQLEFCLPLWMK